MKIDWFISVVLRVALSVILSVILAQAPVANAAEIKVLGARAVQTVWNEIGPEFERTTGHKVKIIVDLGPVFKRQIDAGETFDVAIFWASMIDELIKEGKIIAGTRTNFARLGIGIEVRAGAPKPDISSVEAFKRALLNAKSIAYLKEGASGVYLAGLLNRLGIAEAIKSKVTRPETDIVSELVAKGDVELGMVVITQILTTPGVELVGPLPPELQSYMVFTAGVSANSKAPDAARALIKFLTGPTAIPVIKSQGMEPG